MHPLTSMLSPSRYARFDDENSIYSDDELLPVSPNVAPTVTSTAATPTARAHREPLASLSPHVPHTCRAPVAPNNSSSTATTTATATKLELIVTHVTKETLAQMAQDPTRKLKTFKDRKSVV